MRLIRIIVMNKGHISSLRPFRWKENVRFSWDIIVDVNVVDSMFSR